MFPFEELESPTLELDLLAESKAANRTFVIVGHLCCIPLGALTAISTIFNLFLLNVVVVDIIRLSLLSGVDSYDSTRCFHSGC